MDRTEPFFPVSSMPLAPRKVNDKADSRLLHESAQCMGRKQSKNASPTAPHQSLTWKTGILFALAVTLAGYLSVWYFLNWRQKQIAKDLKDATDSVIRWDFETAASLADRILQRSPSHPQALIIAARSAASRRSWDEAFSFCDRLETTERKQATKSLLKLGKDLVEAGEARRAEETLRLTRHLDPRNSDAAFVLAFVLASEGRSWEAVPLLQMLIDEGRYDIPQLLVVGAPDDLFIDQPEFAQRCLKARPNDSLSILAQARNSQSKNHLARAAVEFRRVATENPWLIEAQARWGQVLLSQDRGNEFLTWHQSLPDEAESHPEIWVARGHWAIRNKQPRVAIRCFAEGIRLSPNLRVANFQLGRLLAEAGQHDLSLKFQNRTQLLSELRVPLGTIMQQRDIAILKRIVDLLEKLGRLREAVAWTELFLREGDAEWARKLVIRLRSQYPDGLPWLVESERLSNQIDFSQFPLPQWRSESPASPRPESEARASLDSVIHFQEESASLGIRFQYHNDAADPENALRMFEFSGGGLAVLDFDGDGWPDLYATQGGHFPHELRPPVDIDRIFRNLGQSAAMNNSLPAVSSTPQFIDSTQSSGLGDPQYSQGVAVGDIDQDGFPDLSVANIGANRLYRNNGDGTFTDITQATALGDDDWTTSCLLADLNGDTFPDLLAVNYLTSTEVYTRICESGGRPRQCPPTTFFPNQDRVWMNQGDGSFAEQTTALTKETTSGRGLGVLATTSDRAGFLNVFVANDTDPNFWHINQTDSKDGKLRFEEQGLASGLALDGTGNPQASMGIAAGDVDHNGLLDLFVTNFYRESNTLYLQFPGDSFQDRTREAGLRDPSFLMLGFGTQFLDADGDGWLDLVLTNGHVYNNSHLEEPWKMPPQFFQNLGNGKFVELSPKTIGRWFAGQYLGRSLVRWDWNRDGRPDFAVSHADAPLAVLTNHSKTANHSLSLSLHGVKSNRDAIGAVVKVTSGTESWTHWLTAGDGFQASNERRLLIGLGPNPVADEIQIDWPSGHSQTLKAVAADQELIVIEGQPARVRQH